MLHSYSCYKFWTAKESKSALISWDTRAFQAKYLNHATIDKVRLKKQDEIMQQLIKSDKKTGWNHANREAMGYFKCANLLLKSFRWQTYQEDKTVYIRWMQSCSVSPDVSPDQLQIKSTTPPRIIEDWQERELQKIIITTLHCQRQAATRRQQHKFVQTRGADLTSIRSNTTDKTQRRRRFHTLHSLTPHDLSGNSALG
jgi:hypothetical protein